MVMRGGMARSDKASSPTDHFTSCSFVFELSIPFHSARPRRNSLSARCLLFLALAFTPVRVPPVGF